MKWAKEVRLAEEAGPDPGESRFFVGSLDLLTHAPSGAACQHPLSLDRPQKIRLPLSLNPLFRSLATAGESELAATGSLALVMTMVPGHPNVPVAKITCSMGAASAALKPRGGLSVGLGCNYQLRGVRPIAPSLLQSLLLKPHSITRHGPRALNAEWALVVRWHVASRSCPHHNSFQTRKFSA
jgi:hypothetical protein